MTTKIEQRGSKWVIRVEVGTRWEDYGIYSTREEAERNRPN